MEVPDAMLTSEIKIPEHQAAIIDPASLQNVVESGLKEGEFELTSEAGVLKLTCANPEMLAVSFCLGVFHVSDV